MSAAASVPRVQATWETRFATGFQKFTSETGKDVPDFMREMMRLFVEKLYHWTAPPTQGNGSNGRAGGKKEIDGDIKIFAIGANDEWLEYMYNRFGPGPMTMVYQNRNGEKMYFQNTEIASKPRKALARMEELHQPLRDKRGRVRKTSRGQGDIRDAILVPYSSRKTYINRVNKRVGKLKAGWIPALKATGSKLPPSWVKKAGEQEKASGVASGFYSEHINSARWSGYVEAENDVKYFRDPTGFRTRARDFMVKYVMGAKFEKWVQQMIDKHGAKS